MLVNAGGRYQDAVGVCAHEMGDPQLALFLCRILEGASGPLRSALLRELIQGTPAHLVLLPLLPGPPTIYKRGSAESEHHCFTLCIHTFCARSWIFLALVWVEQIWRRQVPLIAMMTVEKTATIT